MRIEHRKLPLDGYYVVSVMDIDGKTAEYGRLFTSEEDFKEKKEEFAKEAEKVRLKHS